LASDAPDTLLCMRIRDKTFLWLFSFRSSIDAVSSLDEQISGNGLSTSAKLQKIQKYNLLSKGKGSECFS
jgi:hypothetical protein